MDVTERFLKYVGFDTSSDEESEASPTSAKQLILGKYIADELRSIGLSDVRFDEHGYVYAFVPATCEEMKPIGFIAHMDTSPAVSGANIRPRRFLYKGGDIKLSDSVSIDTAEFENLVNYIGQELIVTDGTTLLGADDKAGVAEIITACEYLIAHPEIKHGKVSVAFTPDEEVGKGVAYFDLDSFDAEYGYTIDGGALGEIEYENFNAAAAKFTINGINIHPGTAKNKMKNAVLIANELISMFPAAETPAHTEKYEGFYHVTDISGNETKVTVNMIIRDHDMNCFLSRKAFTERVTDYMNDKYGKDTIVLLIKDSYFNMKEKIEPVIEIIDKAKKAMEEAGVTPIIMPIRGGTDGAMLSYRGFPCPNLCTGGENFHGIKEFVSVYSMEKIVEIILNLIKNV